MQKKLLVKTEGAIEVKWESLEDIQKDTKHLTPENLKKMINSLDKNGFCEPFVIWNNPSNPSRPIVISGNQRLKALKKCKEMGWDIPPALPAVEVKAKDLKEAKTILLSLASTFGRVDKFSLETFISENALDLDEIFSMSSFPEIPKLNIDPNGNDNKSQSLPKESYEGDEDYDGEIKNLIIPVFFQDFDRIMGLLRKVYEKMKAKEIASSHSEVLLFLLQKWDKENEL